MLPVPHRLEQPLAGSRIAADGTLLDTTPMEIMGANGPAAVAPHPEGFLVVAEIPGPWTPYSTVVDIAGPRPEVPLPLDGVGRLVEGGPGYLAAGSRAQVGAGRDVWVATLGPDGATVVGDEAFLTDSQNNQFVAHAWHDGTSFVLVVEEEGSWASIRVDASLNALDPPQVLMEAGDWTDDVEATHLGSDVVLVGVDQDDQLAARWFAPDGSMTEVGSVPASVTWLAVAGDDEAVTAAWIDRDAHDAVRLAKPTPSGWGDVEVVRGGRNSQRAPDMAMTATGGVAVWVDDRDGDDEVRLGRLDAEGTSVDTPDVPVAPGTVPRVASDGVHARVLWIEDGALWTTLVDADGTAEAPVQLLEEIVEEADVDHDGADWWVVAEAEWGCRILRIDADGVVTDVPRSPTLNGCARVAASEERLYVFTGGQISVLDTSGVEHRSFSASDVVDLAVVDHALAILSRNGVDVQLSMVPDVARACAGDAGAGEQRHVTTTPWPSGGLAALGRSLWVVVQDADESVEAPWRAERAFVQRLELP